MCFVYLQSPIDYLAFAWCGVFLLFFVFNLIESLCQKGQDE